MPASSAVGRSPVGFSEAMQATGLLAGRHECNGHSAMHRHPEIEVNYIASGSIEYRWGTRTLALPQGSVVVFWASVPHLASHLEDGTTQLWYHIPVQVFRGWDLPLTQRILGGELVTFAADTHYDRTVLEQIVVDTNTGLNQSESAYDLAGLLTMRAYLERLCLLNSERFPVGTDCPPTGRAAAMADYIVANAGDTSLTIDKVAQSVALHPTTAMREFRRQYGVTIGTYIHQHRVSWAQQLLVTSDTTTSMIGFQVGFASVSSFYAAFGKMVGMAPGKFRQHASSYS